MTAKNIHQRLAAAMGEVTYIQKERKQGMNYTIVSHDAVTAKVRPVLLKHGIVYYPVRCEHQHNGNRAECAMTVRFVNIDEPADFFDVPTFGYGIDPQDKGPGKAMSYAVKYALLKALGLETGDDADHDSIDHTDRDPAQPDPAIIARQSIGNADTLDALAAIWRDLPPSVKSSPAVIRAKDDRKAQLAEQKEAA
ncbi:ERF family protein [Falsirhodobacter xinxiangensis]|uniref:ERF family protein n=1 Tax=Falsirhodobacter xinxiangensis TaxID=2530049 RepID=UPI0010AA44D8|nr:ERF family protein [Rhodobacter xinxiangensis]